ncbi:MAG TPA: FeoA family protein [Bacillota bacterium]|jgi:Fe2+ transport system protein FeoA
MTLDEARRGQVLIIGGISDGRAKDQALRFGLAAGSEVRCEQALRGGPVVLSRGAMQVAIGRRLCPRIAVELAPRRGGVRRGR